jgi:hypothetical protein
MKKLLAIVALAATGLAFAGDSVTLEGQHIDNVGSNAQKQYVLSAKKEINSNFAVDAEFDNAQTENTNALSTRLEAGAIASYSLGPVSVYTRAALGENYTNTKNFSYYSIEPGVQVPFGPLTAKVGWRYRTAVDSDANGDQTHTMRYSLNYAVTKLDTVGVRYDRVNGDNDQKIVSFNYTRGF